MMVELAETLTEHAPGASSSTELLYAAYKAAHSSPDLLQLLEAASHRIDAARQPFQQVLARLGPTFKGVVASVSPALAVLVSDAGAIVPVARSALESIGLAYPGAAVEVDWEDWGEGAAYFEAFPAVLVPQDDVFVGRSRLLVSAEEPPAAAALGEDLLARLFREAPVIGPIPPVEIGEPEPAIHG
jgi:hypothetical protein